MAKTLGEAKTGNARFLGLFRQEEEGTINVQIAYDIVTAEGKISEGMANYPIAIDTLPTTDRQALLRVWNNIIKPRLNEYK